MLGCALVFGFGIGYWIFLLVLTFSFSLAQDNLSLVGTTDFIGDGECMKKLLKMHVSPDTVSCVMLDTCFLLVLVPNHACDL